MGKSKAELKYASILEAQNKRRRKAKRAGECIWCGRDVAVSKTTGKPARQCKKHLAIEAERKRLAASKKKPASKRSRASSKRSSPPAVKMHKDGGTFHYGPMAEFLWLDDLRLMKGAEGGSDINPDDDAGDSPPKAKRIRKPKPKKVVVPAQEPSVDPAPAADA